jgi:hypothetical protein
VNRADAANADQDAGEHRQRQFVVRLHSSILKQSASRRTSSRAALRGRAGETTGS